MIMNAGGHCACGVAVKGELDEESREFVHSFSFPPGADALVSSRDTEVGRLQLVTFALGDEWDVVCPLCRARILLLKTP